MSSRWIQTTWSVSEMVSEQHLRLLSNNTAELEILTMNITEGMGLATNSDGSYPFGYSEGVDFEKNLAISTIDFGTMHLYPSQCKSPGCRFTESSLLTQSLGGMPDSWGSSWVTAHGAACASANKPCLLEEYGSDSLCTDEQPWQKAATSTNGISGDLFWQYGDSLSTGQSPNDGYTLYYGSSNFTCMTADH